MSQRTTTRNNSRNTRLHKAHPAILAISFVLGVLLHPLCIGFSEEFFSPMQEVFLFFVTVGMTYLMFLLSKSHFLCSLLQAGGLVLNASVFIINRLQFGVNDLLTNMDYEWWFRIILMWIGGVSVTILIRLFAHKKWNAPHIRKSFGRGFLVSSIVFCILYVFLLLDLFIFQRSRFVAPAATLNLIPFKGAFATYWPHIKSGRFTDGIFVQFFGNLLIFAPLGFYLELWWKNHKHKWILCLVPVVLATVIEGCQYIFRIGQSDIDDLWMNVVGFFLGVLLAMILDAIRKLVTDGKEKTIFSFR